MKKIVLSVIIGGPVLLCVLVFVGMLVIRAMWAWVAPDLFPGAVADGLVAREIGWWTAGKLAIVLAILGVFLGSRRDVAKKVHVSARRVPAGRGADAPDVIDAAATSSPDDEQ